MRIYAGIGGRKMFEILKVNGEYVTEEVDQGPALQVPSFVGDPERNRKRFASPDGSGRPQSGRGTAADCGYDQWRLLVDCLCAVWHDYFDD